MNTPLLSVCLITYNHANYITQAIEGVLMQKVNFTWELIIADDCSTDGTMEIVQNYASKYPDFIKPIIRTNNVGAGKNFIELISAPESKYIAYFEGDDFWSDPYKLQKQVDFLEANPDYELCFTNIEIIDDNNEIVKSKLIDDNRKTTWLHRDMPIWAPSLTRVFKNRDFSEIDCDVPGQDALWLLYQSKFGKIGFINEVTGTYRLHDGSIYSSKSTASKKEAVILTYFESLRIVEPVLLPKYFGKIFKKLLEVKSMDLSIFKKNRKLFFGYYKSHFRSFNVIQHLKFIFAFIAISLPISHKTYHNYVNKVFTLYYIYKA